MEPSSLVEEEQVMDKVFDEVEIPVEEPAKEEVTQSVDDSISYLEKLEKAKVGPMYENMIALMQMGFTDFDKNLDLLKKNYNDLNITMNQLLG